MSEINIPLNQRLNSAHRYYDFKHKSRDMHWVDSFLMVGASETFGIPEILVLLNPKNYSELQATDPRGGRAFPSAQSFSKCRSDALWGYQCPFQDARVHIDHTFPHSKGGVTSSQNAMYLCDEHNQSKHTDIHLIPWELFPLSNEWIVKSVEHLMLAASRITTEKLYLPEKHLSRD
jgi:hypothetical protein